MRAFRLLCLQAIVVGLACAGTAAYVRLRGEAELVAGTPDACLPVALALRNRLKAEGVENRILIVEYGLNSLVWRHVAVVFALEDGSLASYESLNSPWGYTRGSVPLGVFSWDAGEIAERLPRQVGARILRARWVEGITYDAMKPDLATAAR